MRMLESAKLKAALLICCDVLLAYARLFGPGQYYDEAAIGRVVTASTCRGQGLGGLGRLLMHRAIEAVERSWGTGPVRIGAQLYLARFYEGFGFNRTGPDYIEDGIPHVHMVRHLGKGSET